MKSKSDIGCFDIGDASCWDSFDTIKKSSSI
jgi:hypothetical protein